MDDICHDSPHTEIIAISDFNLGVLGIGRNQPEASSLPANPFQRVFSIQFTDRNLFLCGIPFTLIDNDDVAIIHSGFYHRTTLHTDQERRVRVWTQHLQHLDVLRQFIVVQRNGETGHHLHIKKGSVNGLIRLVGTTSPNCIKASSSCLLLATSICRVIHFLMKSVLFSWLSR